MSLLDVLGSRVQRSAADARLLYAKLHRGFVEFSATKIVLVPTGSPNGGSPQAVLGAAPPAPATPSLAAAPPVPATPPAPAASPAPPAPPAAAPPAPPPAAVGPPAPAPPPPPPPAPPPRQPAINVPKTVPGNAIRRSTPQFPAPSPAEPSVPVSLRTGTREGNIIFGDRGPSGARLHEARRLNKIAVFGVVVGVLNLIGLVVAIAFAGSMLRAVANSARSTEGTLKIDQRAWVGLNAARLEQPYSRTKLGIAFTLENTGKTPAAVEGIDVSVAAVDVTTSRQFPILSRHGASRSVAPGARESISVFEPKPLSDAGFAALVSGHVKHEFVIVVRYRDVFGEAHRTEICKALVGSAAAITAADSLPSCSPNTMN